MVLLGRRKNCYGDGTWGLPGGHLEYGESIIECAKREIKEEIGIEVAELKLISVIDNIDERGHYLHVSFLLEQFSGEIRCIKPYVCSEWKFFDISNLPQDLLSRIKEYFRTILGILSISKKNNH